MEIISYGLELPALLYLPTILLWSISPLRTFA